MNGKVISRNTREHAPKGQPPPYYYEQSSSREKVNVWAALCGDGTILGPYFFDDNINGIMYLNLLNEEIVPELMIHFEHNLIADVLFPNIWWF